MEEYEKLRIDYFRIYRLVFKKNSKNKESFDWDYVINLLASIISDNNKGDLNAMKESKKKFLEKMEVLQKYLK